MPGTRIRVLQDNNQSDDEGLDYYWSTDSLKNEGNCILRAMVCDRRFRGKSQRDTEVEINMLIFNIFISSKSQSRH